MVMTKRRLHLLPQGFIAKMERKEVIHGVLNEVHTPVLRMLIVGTKAEALVDRAVKAGRQAQDPLAKNRRGMITAHDYNDAMRFLAQKFPEEFEIDDGDKKDS